MGTPTSYKTPIGILSYHIGFGKSCQLFVDLEHKALSELKSLNLVLKKASRERLEKLNEIDDFRLISYEILAINNEKMKNWNDAIIV